MLPPIEKGARRALVVGSLVIALCAIIDVPLASSTSGPASTPSAESSKPEVIRRTDPWRSAMVKVARDPFLAEAAFAKPSARSTQMTGSRHAAGLSVSASVRGLAFGQEPKAVVEVDGATKIVAPGDVIDGSRVTAILSDRILLSGGSVLMFSRQFP